MRIVPKTGHEDDVVTTGSGKKKKVKRETIRLYSLQTRAEMHQLLQDKGFIKKTAEQIELQRVEREKQKAIAKKKGYVEWHRGVKRFKTPPQSLGSTHAHEQQQQVATPKLRADKTIHKERLPAPKVESENNLETKNNDGSSIKTMSLEHQEGAQQQKGASSITPVLAQIFIIILGVFGILSMLLRKTLCKTNTTASILRGRKQKKQVRAV